MLHSPISPYRNAFISNLKFLTDDEVLELFYNCLRWINYFQDEDNSFIYRKIYQDVHNEIKRRGVRYTWTAKDVKKYRILGQKMYYGSLSVKELEWRLGCILLYSIPVCRNVVKENMYLVRETIQIIIDCIHEQYAWSELEYNKDILEVLDVPFFSYENFCTMFRIAKGIILLCENILIFFLFLGTNGLKITRPVWEIFDPEYKCLGNIQQIIKILVGFMWASCYMYRLFD